MVTPLDKTKTYPCHECGQVAYGFGEIPSIEWDRRGSKSYSTPEGLMGWRCTECGETQIGPEQRRAINAHVDALIAQDEAGTLRAHVEQIAKATGLDRRAISEACGIHYTYLSKIVNGRRPAGAPLARLLQVYAEYPHVLSATFQTTGAMAAPNLGGAAPAVAARDKDSGMASYASVLEFTTRSVEPTITAKTDDPGELDHAC